ncbi:hypothetical protein CJF32_00010132 [Rutstroemia sp. NJR-2017a WRK4]|nr:hypothetical protein CJF32_00010132 [Rutstroemia sp. NJR-2017a WRK4]PQE28851.1 hypothetical protein CJF30_00003882 [Rutstroemia sp. NJR-2017a BBW]
MAGSQAPPDPNKALELKKKGNDHFQSGKYEAAEQLYAKAISLDPTNSVLYTNHSKALLKLARYPEAVASSEAALGITPHNMKAWYNIAQARHAMHEYEKALHAVEKAREECVREGGKMVSLPNILELGLKCRKEWWEEKERRRIRETPGLLGEVLGLMDREESARVEGKDPEEVQKVKEVWEGKKEQLERVFRLVETMGKEGKRREMPDWAVDGITFNVMTDPVVTKTGQSYERSSILQHLERSQTDPLTREPLTAKELRPNLALKHAIEEFLDENGWAVDW